jgi:glycerophosphoryl diester phosphodiesterase
MLSLNVRVLLFDPSFHNDPVTDGFPVTDGITVDVARFPAFEAEDPEEVIPLRPDPASGLFTVESQEAQVDADWFFRVTFERRNFSLRLGTLLHPEEVTPDALPVFAPARLPVWDSGWDDGYETNEFFGEEGVLTPASADRPIVLAIPLRRVYIIGHRGAPHHFPENSLASYERALDLGANGLEFDLCLTRDRRIAVFHDPRPDSMRQKFEDLPYELVSPEIDGRIALIKALRGLEYRVVRRKPLLTRASLDIVKLRFEQVRTYYKYHHVNGVEYPVPDLEEFLGFVSSELKRAKMLFFDVKNAPSWDPGRRIRRFVEFGALIGRTLQKFPWLPDTMVIANEIPEVLDALRQGILGAGEGRCQFAYDAAGGAAALVGIKEDPLEMARTLGNDVVSVGSLARAGDLDDILEATRDRDYDTASRLVTVLHWTLNDREKMHDSFRAGVNGIVTDKPDVMKKLMDDLRVYVG